MNETTILVIEDDKSIQNFMKISLKTRGYAYILADNGLSGISLFYNNICHISISVSCDLNTFKCMIL